MVPLRGRAASVPGEVAGVESADEQSGEEVPAREQASEDEQERQQPWPATARPPSLPPRVRARVALPQLTTRSSAHGCARACSQDDPPCGACLAAGCTLCGLADAHEEEVQAHADGCSRLHYALYGTDDEESSDDEAVEELESTLEPPEGEAAAAEAILLEYHFCIRPSRYRWPN